MRATVPASIGVLFLLTSSAAHSLVLNPVVSDQRSFDPVAGEEVQIRFRIDAPAQIRLEIWDLRDRRVRELRSEGELPAGEHALPWDGRDEKGRTVPPGAYHYTMEASGGDGSVVRHDPTDSSGGDEVRVAHLRWDPETARVHYVAPADCIVSVRAGLGGGGPFLRTIVDWAARPGGRHAEPWDGQDASAVLDLRRHPKLDISVQAISLPTNTVFVSPQARASSQGWIDFEEEPPQRPAAREKRPGWFAVQAPHSRRDVPIVLSLVDEEGKPLDGQSPVAGPVRVQLEVPDAAERERLLAERFEVVFFVDGLFRFENEVGFLPTSWRWDTSAIAPGVHYVTANLLGYRGNFGTATIALDVAGKTEAE